MNTLDTIAAELDPAMLGYLHSLGATLPAAQAVQQFVAEWCEYRTEPPGLDVWQSPVHTLQHRTADCEDSAILKFALLRLAGVDAHQLSLVYGRRAGTAHVVLNVTFDGETWTLDLDRLSPAEDALPLEVLAYTNGTMSAYEWGSWSDEAAALWDTKVNGALGGLA